MKSLCASFLLFAGPAAAQRTGVVWQATTPAPVVVSVSPAPMGPSEPVEAQSSSVARYVNSPSFPPPAVSVGTPPPSTVIMGVPSNRGTPGRVLPWVPYPTPQPAQHIVRMPVPRKAAQDYVTSDDYPPAALAMRAEGRVEFTLIVGIDGRVADCSVLVSSGSRTLDFVTCRLIRSRARFIPAIDSNGNPAVARVNDHVDWRLPG